MYDNTDFDAVPIVNKRKEIAPGPCEPQPAVFFFKINTDASSHSITFSEGDRRYPNKIPSCFTD